MLSLFREAGRAAFDTDDSAFVAGLSEPLADAVRDLTRPRTPSENGTARRAPGLLLFDADGPLRSVNHDADAWLDELSGDHSELDETGVRLPNVVLATWVRARGHAQARARTAAQGAGWSATPPACARPAATPARPRW
jgi:hypothetical protein